MKKKNALSQRDSVLLVFLIVLITAALYYMAFYTPLQNELATLSEQAKQLDVQITEAGTKVNKLNAMQAELDVILSQPENEITEIAPYDNKDVVLTQLYSVLAQTQDYSLNLTDPNIGEDGTVRRQISMSFHCASYAAAKTIIQELTEGRWRCLVSDLSISTDNGDLMNGGVSVSMTITFFEHTGLTKE